MPDVVKCVLEVEDGGPLEIEDQSAPISSSRAFRDRVDADSDGVTRKTLIKAVSQGSLVLEEKSVEDSIPSSKFVKPPTPAKEKVLKQRFFN